MNEVNITRFSFSKTAKMFFKPLSKRKHAYLTLTITAVIVAIVYVLLSGVISQNCMGASVLGIELSKESGREFMYAKNHHKVMVSKYVKHIKKRYASLLVDLLYPEYSFKKQLKRIEYSFEASVSGEDQAREVIHNAGEQIRGFCVRTDRFPSGEVIWFIPQRIPASLLMDLNGTLVKAEEFVTKLEDHPTLKNAKASCMYDREAILLFSLARLFYGYKNQQDIQKFRIAVERAHKSMLNLADRIEGDNADDAALLKKYAQSEQRRLDILDALSHDNMYVVRVQLREAIEKAYQENNERPS